MTFIRTGLRAVREAPALAMAEIAWRWTFGAVVWIAFALMVRTIMAGVDVSRVEKNLAQNSDAFRIADAIARVLVQVLPRFVHALAIAVPVLALVWIVAATFGREATLHALLAPYRTSIHNRFWPSGGSIAFARVLLLNAVRAFFTIATFIAFFGAIFIVSAHTSPDMQSPVAPLLVLAWMLLGLFFATIWAVINWFLSLAPIFCVRDGRGPWGAIGASLGLYRQRSRDYLAIASAFGLFRLAALIVAILAGLVVVAAGSVRVAVVLSIVVALVYFAAADLLYIARMASFVALAAAPPELAQAAAGETHSPVAPDLKIET